MLLLWLKDAILIVSLLYLTGGIKNVQEINESERFQAKFHEKCGDPPQKSAWQPDEGRHPSVSDAMLPACPDQQGGLR